MSLIELLVVAIVCTLLVLLGRALFGAHGWLLGAVPFGGILGIVLFAPLYVSV